MAKIRDVHHERNHHRQAGAFEDKLARLEREAYIEQIEDARREPGFTDRWIRDLDEDGHSASMIARLVGYGGDVTRVHRAVLTYCEDCQAEGQLVAHFPSQLCRVGGGRRHCTCAACF